MLTKEQVVEAAEMFYRAGMEPYDEAGKVGWPDAVARVIQEAAFWRDTIDPRVEPQEGDE